LGGPQSRSGHGGEEKNSQPLLGLEPPVIRPVAQFCTTELSRLLPFAVKFVFTATLLDKLTALNILAISSHTKMKKTLVRKFYITTKQRE
jgi:hypothetical protein